MNERAELAIFVNHRMPIDCVLLSFSPSYRVSVAHNLNPIEEVPNGQAEE